MRKNRNFNVKNALEKKSLLEAYSFRFYRDLPIKEPKFNNKRYVIPFNFLPEMLSFIILCNKCILSNPITQNSTPMKIYVSFFTLILFMLAQVNLLQASHKHDLTEIMTKLVEGKYEEAIEASYTFLEEYPNDPEAYFMLAIGHAQQGDIDKAMDYVKASVQNNLPYTRYLAGPRKLLKPLVQSKQFQDWQQTNGHELIHGPMLSNVTPNSAEFWVRTYKEVPVQVILHAFESKDTIRSEVINTDAGKGYTGIVHVDGLKPNTEYKYNLIIDGNFLGKRRVFHTYPEEGKPLKLKMGFGGGAGFNPVYDHMWNTLSSHWFPAFLLMGDNVYIDRPKYPQVQDYTYFRRQSTPQYRNFISRTSIYSIWDDHDFGVNDSWGTTKVDSPAWKIPVWEKFKTHWNNPGYGGGKDQPGVWYDFSIGDIQFFMLDCRYYRSSPIAEDKTMLGEAQKKWLLNALEQSDATFKVIASAVPWSLDTKKGTREIDGKTVSRAYDTWHGFQNEREEIFSFIEDQKIEGVLLLSADRHRSDAWQISRLKGYDFYEFESSKLTNRHTHWIMPESLFGYNEKCSLGLLKFNTIAKDPQVTYQIVNIDNEVINEITIKRSQLDFDNLRFEGVIDW